MRDREGEELLEGEVEAELFLVGVTGLPFLFFAFFAFFSFLVVVVAVVAVVAAALSFFFPRFDLNLKNIVDTSRFEVYHQLIPNH